MCKTVSLKMLKSSALLILFSLSFIMGCKSPNEPVNPAGYIPLAVGNKWYYNDDSHDTTSINFVQEITGQKVIDNKNYYEVISTDLTSGDKGTFYYRLNKDTLFVRDTTNGERVFADFSLKVNEPAYWAQDLKVTLKSDQFMIFATPWGMDYGFSMTFKRGIGMINSAANGLVYYRTKLIKAEIK
ncbi:MAG: hypothetical protein HF310_16230 [Ignavibacteria bacterium]|jgi:hypothetical protein|nr:hypothetical protein [Ignavibacteria bacterium]